MIKALLISLAFLFFAIGTYAQVEIHIASHRLYTPKDSFREPRDTMVHMYYYVRISGTNSYSGVLNTHLKTDKGFFHLSDTTVSNVASTDSIHMSAPIYFSSNAFNTGKDIIVIWPTGTGAKTIDSLQREIEVQYFSNRKLASVASYLNGSSQFKVKAYPDPAYDLLQIELNDPSLILKRLSIENLQGQVLMSRVMPEKTLDISVLPPGMYLLKLQTATGEEAILKLLKN